MKKLKIALVFCLILSMMLSLTGCGESDTQKCFNMLSDMTSIESAEIDMNLELSLPIDDNDYLSSIDLSNVKMQVKGIQSGDDMDLDLYLTLEGTPEKIGNIIKVGNDIYLEKEILVKIYDLLGVSGAMLREKISEDYIKLDPDMLTATTNVSSSETHNIKATCEALGNFTKLYKSSIVKSTKGGYVITLDNSTLRNEVESITRVAYTDTKDFLQCSIALIDALTEDFKAYDKDSFLSDLEGIKGEMQELLDDKEALKEFRKALKESKEDTSEDNNESNDKVENFEDVINDLIDTFEDSSIKIVLTKNAKEYKIEADINLSSEDGSDISIKGSNTIKETSKSVSEPQSFINMKDINFGYSSLGLDTPSHTNTGNSNSLTDPTSNITGSNNSTGNTLKNDETVDPLHGNFSSAGQGTNNSEVSINVSNSAGVTSLKTLTVSNIDAVHKEVLSKVGGVFEDDYNNDTNDYSVRSSTLKGISVDDYIRCKTMKGATYATIDYDISTEETKDLLKYKDNLVTAVKNLTGYDISQNAEFTKALNSVTQGNAVDECIELDMSDKSLHGYVYVYGDNSNFNYMNLELAYYSN